MADEDEGIVIVEEKVEVTVIPPPTVAPKSSNSTPPWVGIGIVSVLVAILSIVLVWLPMHRQNKLWGLKHPSEVIPAGDDVCRRVSAPSFCNDVVIDKGSGLAFLACDPFKPYFYPPYELNNVSQVYGDGGIWVYHTNAPLTPPLRLHFRDGESPPGGFHPISLTISPLPNPPMMESEGAERVIRLLVASYPVNVDDGIVEVIDFHIPPASFLTNMFGIKHSERGGELSYVATIRSTFFTSPAGIVAVKDQPSFPSDSNGMQIPSFYLTNTYRHKGVIRDLVEKRLQIGRADLIFYNARAEGSLQVGFGLEKPGAVTTDSPEGLRVYVASQSGPVHFFEQFYIDSSGKQLSSFPIKDRELQVQKLMHPTRNEEIEIFHPTFMQSSYFATTFPVTGIAALPPPTPHALGGEIFIIGSPRHHLFDEALRTESEAVVPVSIYRLRPFYYVFNRKTKKSDKIYAKDDERLVTGVRGDTKGQPDRKKWWEVITLWTGVDFGAGPGGIAVRETGSEVVVVGVAGGKKGGLVICTAPAHTI